MTGTESERQGRKERKTEENNWNANDIWR